MKVQRGERIRTDLETSPFYIKTNSTAGSNEKIALGMNITVANGNSVWRSVRVYFTSSMKYTISGCSTELVDFPTQPTEAVDKTWKFVKSGTALTVFCDKEEVLVFKFDSGGSDCKDSWNGKVTQARISSDDTASDHYFIIPGGIHSRF